MSDARYTWLKGGWVDVHQVAPRHRPGAYASPAPGPTGERRRWKSVVWALVYLSGFAVFMAVAVARLNAGDVPANARTTTYTVQAGDTLYGVVKRFDSTLDPRAVVDWIYYDNHLSTDTIQPGQSLTVPIERDEK